MTKRTKTSTLPEHTRTLLLITITLLTTVTATPAATTPTPTNVPATPPIIPGKPAKVPSPLLLSSRGVNTTTTTTTTTTKTTEEEAKVELEEEEEEEDVLGRMLSRSARHFSSLDLCDNAVCDQIVRQANGLARLKTVRRYIVNTVSALDSLVTALDAELVVAAETLTRTLGNRCRAAHAILAQVTKGPTESDRLNDRSSAFVYGREILNRFS